MAWLEFCLVVALNAVVDVVLVEVEVLLVVVSVELARVRRVGVVRRVVVDVTEEVVVVVVLVEVVS